jgi:DNA mismatch repair protein MutS
VDRVPNNSIALDRARSSSQVACASLNAPPAAEQSTNGAPTSSLVVSGQQPSLTPLDDWSFQIDRAGELLQTHFGVASLEGFGLAGRDMAVAAAGAALHYARETQKQEATHISGLSFFEPSDYLILDSPTVRNLELVEALDGTRSRTLLGVIDETVTGMGSRLLKQWLLRPSMRIAEPTRGSTRWKSLSGLDPAIVYAQSCIGGRPRD